MAMAVKRCLRFGGHTQKGEKSYGFIKNLRQIHPRDNHVKFMGKIVGNTT